MNQTIQKMKQMRLQGMVSLQEQRHHQNAHKDYSTDEYVDLLIDHEWENRHRRKTDRLIKNARFKINVAISDVDLALNRGLDRDLFTRLVSLNFIKDHQNIILTGPSGVGKSFIAQAIGHQACLNGMKTIYTNTSKILAQLKFAKLDNTYIKKLEQIAKHQLLILDDFGLQQMDKVQREILMDIIEDRHHCSATIITSQIPIGQWHDIIGEGTIADAILDRVIHNGYKFNLKGDSLRKKNQPK